MVKEKEKNIENIEVPSLEEMLKAGVHFGHKTSKWNSKMKSYIFTSRNNIHIIDLEQTQQRLKKALKFLQEIKENKGKIVFVGTKVAAKDIICKTAKESNMHYVTERWIGGTLTNFQAISNRLKYFRDLENKKKTGELDKYTKKEQHDFSVELEKLEQRFGGIKEMVSLPSALFVIDIYNDALAVKEARAKNIPVIGLCDTNADPNSVDYSIPANDDAISSLELILGSVSKILN
ncbi:30S ribosomal protein S2 [Patescibacteria group bacterium]